MNNVLLVAVAESSSFWSTSSRLLAAELALLRREALWAPAAGGVLEDQIDALLVPEVAVHAFAVRRLYERVDSATPSPRRVEDQIDDASYSARSAGHAAQDVLVQTVWISISRRN